MRCILPAFGLFCRRAKVVQGPQSKCMVLAVPDHNKMATFEVLVTEHPLQRLEKVEIFVSTGR